MPALALDAIPSLRSGRPGRRPGKLHADKACDAKVRRQACRARGIVPRIGRGGIENSEKLGRRRWVVARTHPWFNRVRRLPVRCERRSDTYEAFTCLVTINQIRRFCSALSAGGGHTLTIGIVSPHVLNARCRSR